MSAVDDYLANDRVLPDRLAALSDRVERLAVLDAAVREGEVVVRDADDPTDAANVMLALAGTCLLAVAEEHDPAAAEGRARAAAGWAGRTVRLAGTDPGPVLYFVPKAGTIVAAAMEAVPDETRAAWRDLLAAWSRLVLDAIGEQPRTVADAKIDLIVGLSLLEGSDEAPAADVGALRRAAAGILERAEHSFASAGEEDLAGTAGAARRRAG